MYLTRLQIAVPGFYNRREKGRKKERETEQEIIKEPATHVHEVDQLMENGWLLIVAPETKTIGIEGKASAIVH